MEKFAGNGLRTLLFAMKEISQDKDIMKMDINELESDL